MPIIKTNIGYVYFSHIPKCAGTSIENYIKNLSINSISFLDRSFNFITDKDFFCSSPQHILGDSISRLFAGEFFYEYFAVFRDPLERFKSAFFFHAAVKKSISKDIDCNYFISENLIKNYLKPGWFDNHFQPQNKFIVPEKNYKFFLMNKKGMRNLKKYIDLLFLHTSFDEYLPKDNVLPVNILKEKEKLRLNKKSISILNEIYKNDFYLINKIKEDDYSANKAFSISIQNNFKLKEISLNKKDEIQKFNEIKIQEDIKNFKLKNTYNNHDEIKKLNEIINLSSKYIEELKLNNQNLKLENKMYLRKRKIYVKIKRIITDLFYK